MGLAAILSSPPQPKRKECGVQAWIDTLSAEDQAAVQAACTDERWNSVALFETLSAAGLTRGLSQLRLHRRGACPCV